LYSMFLKDQLIIFAGSYKHMNKIPLITIAICTYNRAEYLRDTLADLQGQSADPGDFEILVINNNSADHTTEVCSDFSNRSSGLSFRWVSETRQGLSFARNRALEEALSDVILYIDDDVHLPADFVLTALSCLKKYPDVDCAGGRIFVSFDENDTSWIPDELMPMFGLHDLGDRDRIYPLTNFPRGGNMLIKKNLFESYGAFNTELGRIGSELLGSEEKEFFERIRKEGVKLHYWSELKLWHRIGAVRLKEPYLKKQSEGIGRSERLRTAGSNGRVIVKFISEVSKMAGSLFLSVIYLIRGRAKAAGFLLKFRIWVLKGFMFGNVSMKH
jgi:glucosyl-dolichyl phosphate glucuronosyltransferase